MDPECIALGQILCVRVTFTCVKISRVRSQGNGFDLILNLFIIVDKDEELGSKRSLFSSLIHFPISLTKLTGSEINRNFF